MRDWILVRATFATVLDSIGILDRRHLDDRSAPDLASSPRANRSRVPLRNPGGRRNDP
jgi:hypothetical protein